MVRVISAAEARDLGAKWLEPAGSRGILAGEHPQRLAREALFLLVFGSRPAIKDRRVARLTGSQPL